jgi:hypothetical protein
MLRWPQHSEALAISIPTNIGIGTEPGAGGGERIVLPSVRTKEHVHGLACLHLPQNQSADTHWN